MTQVTVTLTGKGNNYHIWSTSLLPIKDHNQNDSPELFFQAANPSNKPIPTPKPNPNFSI